MLNSPEMQNPSVPITGISPQNGGIFATMISADPINSAEISRERDIRSPVT